VLIAPVIGQEPADKVPTLPARRATTPRPERIGTGRETKLDVLIADTTEPIENPTPSKVLELAKGGKLAATTRLHLVTIDQHPTFEQFAGRVIGRTIPLQPFTAARGRGAPAQPNNSGGGGFGRPETINTSIQFQATTMLDDDGSILMQVYLERPEGAVPTRIFTADASGEARRNLAFTWQSTVQLKSGEPAIVSCRESVVGNEQSQTIVVLKASAGPELAKGKP
jgi:hypothetical protein